MGYHSTLSLSAFSLQPSGAVIQITHSLPLRHQKAFSLNPRANLCSDIVVNLNLSYFCPTCVSNRVKKMFVTRNVSRKRKNLSVASNGTVLKKMQTAL